MASHGDSAEGGINEEFSDIIKWRSGMLVYLYTFAVSKFIVSRVLPLRCQILPSSAHCIARTSCIFVCCQKTPTEPEIMLCMDNLSSHGGKGIKDGSNKGRREQEKVD